MKTSAEVQDSEIPIWPSFTDIALIVSAILLFYLITEFTISSQTAAVMFEINQRQQKLREAVENNLPQGMKEGLSIQEDGNLQRYSFADWVLFDRASAELKLSGKEILRSFGMTIGEHSSSYASIQIEGHTDNDRITQRYPSNWELSSARATTVVRFFEKEAALNPVLLSATGYSQYHPVDAADTKAAKAKNRRVEIVIRWSVQDIKESINQVSNPETT